jgi:hypothetical protein
MATSMYGTYANIPQLFYIQEEEEEAKENDEDSLNEVSKRYYLQISSRRWKISLDLRESIFKIGLLGKYRFLL